MNGDAQYLLAVYRAAEDGADPVAPGDVAEAVDRSPAATTEMLQRLDSRGLVSHEPYEGVTLTDEGRAAAESTHRTYVVLSRFLREVLGVDDHETEALRLVGTVSPTVVDRLDETLLDDAPGDADSATS